MKKCLLFTLTVLGFTSISHALPRSIVLSCDSEVRGVGASLQTDSEFGIVAFLSDIYDSAQSTTAKPNLLGLECNEVGTSVECEGTWMHGRGQAKVIFTTDTSGNVSATFNRSSIRGGEVVSIACIKH
jgi:hypothetical protein